MFFFSIYSSKVFCMVFCRGLGCVRNMWNLIWQNLTGGAKVLVFGLFGLHKITFAAYCKRFFLTEFKFFFCSNFSVYISKSFHKSRLVREYFKTIGVGFYTFVQTLKGTVQRKLTGVLSGINRKLIIWA
jgi:hypothetical protein